MQTVSVALNRDNLRNLQLWASDEQEIELVVYAEDGDDTPLANVTGPRIVFPYPAQTTIPIDTAFTVPDQCNRQCYRLVAEVGGVTTTLAHGQIIIKGGSRYWPYYSDYGGPWGWGW